jgi:hypothetical protein
MLAFAAVALAFPTRPSPALEPGTIDVRISAGTDDVEELENGWLYRGSTDLELTEDTDRQVLGLRFGGVTIPREAQITAAWVQFTVDEASTGPSNLTIAGVPGPVGALPNFHGVTAQPTTGASAAWQPPAWPSVGAAGADQRTPDLSAVLQQMIDHPSWAGTGALMLVVSGTGRRTAESFDGKPGAAPLLHVEWSGDQQPTTTTSPTTTQPGTTTTTTKATTTTTTQPTTTTTAPPTGSGIAERRIAGGTDDVEELPNGTLYVTSSDLEMVRDWAQQVVGMRFTGIGIPQGATVTAAWVQFTADEASPGEASLTIRAHAVDDAPAMSGPYAVTAPDRSVATVTWEPPPWPTAGPAGPDQRTPDLSGVIQSLVDRSGWASGNAVTLIVSGTGRRTARSFEGSPGTAPLLHIEWTTDPGAAPPNRPPVVTGEANGTIVGHSATLVADASDDGLPNPPGMLTYSWTMLSGPAPAQIDDPSRAATTALLPAVGTYRFEAAVSDGEATVRVEVSAVATSEGSGTTRLAAIGDYGDGRALEQQVSDMIDAWGPDAIVTLGDNVYSNRGFDRLVGRYFHEWIGAYSGSYGPGSAVNRFFPALGNHDYDDVGLAQYLSYFTLPGEGLQSSNTSGNERYYDVVIGNIHLFVLNSEEREPHGTSPASTQGQWLQQALAGSTTRWQIVAFHHPPFSSIAGKSAARMNWPFRQWGADLVLSGDAHVYERLETGGLTYAISGLGVNASPLAGPLHQHSRAFYGQDGDAGAILITACADAIAIEYRAVNGGVVDSVVLGPAPCP